MQPRILIVDDEPKIADVLRDYCRKEQYAVEVLYSGDGVVEAIRRAPPSLVVLDLMLPGKDGLSICREVRGFSTVPIVMLTARVDEIDRLIGLELGADDYICKPFSPREVVARIKAILRRVAMDSQSGDAGLLRYGEITIDPARFSCRYGEQVLELTPVEMRILGLLAGSPGRVFSRDHIMQAAYDDHRVVNDRTVDSHVKNIRRKLTDAGGDAELVRSIYGVGYKLE
ncbi:MAG: response regulator [Pseudomonadales bacterium]